MGRKKLTMTEKTYGLMLLKDGASVTRVAANLHVSRRTICSLKQAAARLPDNTIPIRKVGSGGKKKTTERTNTIVKREVLLNPSITAASLKKKHPMLLQDVSIRTIQHRLQKDLNMPSRRAAKKPLLTAPMMKKRIQFCKTYLHWTSADWLKVMFSDESTFRLVRAGSALVRRPPGASRYDSKYTVKTVKHPDSVMVWGAFSGIHGRGGLYFLPKNVTMRGANYLEVLQQHLLPFWHIHQCHHFMHDGAPAHRTKIVKKWLQDQHIPALEWPGNSPDLNPIENAWNVMKNKIQEQQPSSIPDLKKKLLDLWVHMDIDYFEKLANSMPTRLQKVIEAKGQMTKY